MRSRAGGADRLLQPRRRHAPADARADRDAPRGRGPRARARPGVRELQGRIPRSGRAAGRARGGARLVTTAVEPRLTRNWSNPDAVGLDGYVAAGGYGGLRTAVAMADADIVEVVKASGLRGRGGAGFPTGMKWGFVPRDTS